MCSSGSVILAFHGIGVLLCNGLRCHLSIRLSQQVESEYVSYIPPNNSFRHLFAAWVGKLIPNSLIIILIAHQNRQLGGLLDLKREVKRTEIEFTFWYLHSLKSIMINDWGWSGFPSFSRWWWFRLSGNADTSLRIRGERWRATWTENICLLSRRPHSRRKVVILFNMPVELVSQCICWASLVHNDFLVRRIPSSIFYSLSACERGIQWRAIMRPAAVSISRCFQRSQPWNVRKSHLIPRPCTLFFSSFLFRSLQASSK